MTWEEHVARMRGVKNGHKDIAGNRLEDRKT